MWQNIRKPLKKRSHLKYQNTGGRNDSTNNLKEIVVWHVILLLGSDCDMVNYTMPITRQRNNVFHVFRAEVLYAGVSDHLPVGWLLS